MITGLGVVSPVGVSMIEHARRVSLGERAVPVPLGSRSAVLVPKIPAICDPPNARARRLDRFCRMMLSASYMAAESAGLEVETCGSDRVGLSVGTGLGCLLTAEEYNRKVVEDGVAAASPRLFAYTVSSAAAGEISIALGIKGPNVTAHYGLAAGVGALGYGFDLIRSGRADVVLAGGGDVCGAALVTALAEMRLCKDDSETTPFTDSVPGILPSEGAVVAVLESADSAARRGVQPLATIDGYAVGFEPTLTQPRPKCTGLSATMQRAVSNAGRVAGELGVMMASAHGTPLDNVELAAAQQVFGTTSNTLIIAQKRALGDSFAAAGLLDLVLAIGLWHEAGPWRAMNTAFDISGIALNANEAQRRTGCASAALVHSLCYAGSVVALVLSR